MPPAASRFQFASKGSERKGELAVGLLRSGKPVLRPGLIDLWALTWTIGRAAPKAG
jgi:hypothetical protein